MEYTHTFALGAVLGFLVATGILLHVLKRTMEKLGVLQRQYEELLHAAMKLQDHDRAERRKVVVLGRIRRSFALQIEEAIWSIFKTKGVNQAQIGQELRTIRETLAEMLLQNSLSDEEWVIRLRSAHGPLADLFTKERSDEMISSGLMTDSEMEVEMAAGDKSMVFSKGALAQHLSGAGLKYGPDGKLREIGVTRPLPNRPASRSFGEFNPKVAMMEYGEGVWDVDLSQVPDPRSEKTDVVHVAFPVHGRDEDVGTAGGQMKVTRHSLAASTLRSIKPAAVIHKDAESTTTEFDSRRERTQVGHSNDNPS